MTRRLSNWSKPGEKPPMVGVWETHTGNFDTLYQHWNGKAWGAYSISVDGAYRGQDRPSQSNPLRIRFRGLADKPE